MAIFIAMDMKRKWRSTTLKVEHLKLELEDRQEAMMGYESGFLTDVAEALADADIVPPGADQETKNAHIRVAVGEIPSEDPPQPEVGGEVEQPQKVEPSDACKRLWRSIATLTHPDKTGGDPDMTQLYKKAADAFAVGHYDVLLSIAVQLGISSSEPSGDELTALQRAAQDLENRVKEIESSVLWMWGNASPEKRRVIVDAYLRSKGKQRKVKKNDEGEPKQ